MQIKLAGVVKESITDGPGVRLSVFTQGCSHNCPECHNPHTHDYAAGYWEEIDNILDKLAKKPLIHGVTISGGEPLDQPLAVLELAKKTKELNKSVIIYTGYTWEQVLTDPLKAAILPFVWVLVDGPYLVEQRDLGLAFRGSGNQRLINVAATMKADKVIELEL